MAFLESFSAPSQVGLGAEQRDTGTINVILPPQFISLHLCLEGDLFAGPVQVLDDFPILLEQDGERQQVGRIGPHDALFDWWHSKHSDLSDDEPDCNTTGQRTDDDSSRIIAQVNEQNEWKLRGVGPGEAEWVILSEDGAEVARQPVTLTGGPPLLEDVSLTVSPALEGRAITGDVVVGNPAGVGVNVALDVTATIDGQVVGSASITDAVPGVVRLGSTNRTRLAIPSIAVPDGVGGEATIRVEGTANGVTLEAPTAAVDVPAPGEIDVTGVSVSPSPVTVGEPATVRVSATNVGGLSTTRTLAVTAGGRQVGQVAFELAGGASGTQTVSFTPAAPGTLTVNAAGETATLTVLEPGEVVVESVDVAPLEVTPGETITVSITATNPGGSTASRTVDVDANGATASVTFSLEGGETATRTATVTPSTAGELTVDAAGQSVSVTVAEPPAPEPEPAPEPAPEPEPDAPSGPSGETVAVAGLVAAAIAAALLAG